MSSDQNQRATEKRDEIPTHIFIAKFHLLFIYLVTRFHHFGAFLFVKFRLFAKVFFLFLIYSVF